jgi:LmbE family N-acetylglucosaminyl deacetylase
MDPRLEGIKRVLILTAHADDCEFFAGGLVALLARNGAEITEVIATDNGRGSFVLDSSTLVTQSREVEAMEAARILGKKHVEFLGYPDGFLDETPKNELRRIFMKWIRKVRPDCLISFDPFAPFETHPDHLHVAQAAVEAVGFAHMPLFHTEQIEDGLEPHLTPLNIWFAKNGERNNTIVDIGGTLQTKIEALLAHESQMHLTITEWTRLIQATGKHREMLPLLDVNNARAAMELVIPAWASGVAADQTFHFGEGFRFEDAGEILDAVGDLEADF